METRFAPLAALSRRLTSGRGLVDTARARARSVPALARLARAEAAEIVHTNTSILLGGEAVASRAGAAHVMHVREIYPGRHQPRGRLLWPLLRRRLLRADAVLCVSAAAAAQFDGASRVCVLHDGLVRTPQPAPRTVARRALGLHPQRPVAAVVGRISDWKGQEVLARALAEPPLARVAAIGLVAGEAAAGQAHFERSLVGLGRRLGLGERLRLLGFRDDLETIFGAADVVAVPSTAEDAFPNAALEAAAAGLPIVATAAGGLPEIVRDGVTGRLVPAGDPAALAAAIRDLADNPARARRLGEAAADDVRQRFGLGRTLTALQACYDGLDGARR